MTATTIDWFTSVYDNAQLSEIFTNYHYNLFDQEIFLPRTTGRCTLVNQLEALGKMVASLTPAQRMDLGHL